MVWVLVWGFAISHWMSVAAQAGRVHEDPLVVVQFWNGISSVGGFFGAWAGMVWFLKRHGEPLLVYADLLIYGLLVGWVFGRLGCSLVHDHPGKIASPAAWLAVGPWPDGTLRHDLGLYELVFTVALWAIADFLFRWKRARPGVLTGLTALAYAPVRFALDFLRADAPVRGVSSMPDVRYFGLTAAQYFTITFFLVGLWLVLRRSRPRDDEWTRA
jgi:phosphatidylglycerol---prolipoprotein diacylglyceryl transferase